MINLNGSQYRLCLLDTNALSDVAKQGAAFRHFVTWSIGAEPSYVPCFTPFTLLEIRRRDDVYQRVLDVFSVFPCMLLKSHEQLLEEETGCYPDPSGVDPCLLAFSPLGGDGMNLKLVLASASSDEFFRSQEQYWNNGQDEIVDGITSLVANFPPQGKSYTPDDIQLFVELAGFAQLAMRAPGFAESVHDRNASVDMDAFPSLKATTYTVFHKFYVDESRKPTRSDAFDLIIASAIPYVDAVITESHQAEVLRKTKRLDPFIDELCVFTLRDFRSTAPPV